MHRIASTLLVLAGLTCVTPAGAQGVTDVVVMRRAIAPPNRTANPSPTPTASPLRADCGTLDITKFIYPDTGQLPKEVYIPTPSGPTESVRIARAVAAAKDLCERADGLVNACMITYEKAETSAVYIYKKATQPNVRVITNANYTYFYGSLCTQR